jgi:hypothetical protein
MTLSDSAILPESNVIPLTDSAILPGSSVIPAHDRTTIDPGHDATTIDLGGMSAHDATTIDPGSLSGADTHRDSRPPGASLPPLPTAAPYTPPPRFSTGASPTVAHESASSSAPSSGAPDRSMGVPPTRPTGMPSDRPIRQLPFTKKQLAIGGGGLAVLIVVLAIALSGGSKKPGASTKPGAGATDVGDEAKSDPVPQVIERANALIESEDYEEAVATLKRARKANPDNAQLAFLSGRANFGRLWWSDGIADFRDAIRLDDSYKENDELLKAVLKGFLTTPDVDDRIVSFMREIGPPMRPLLEETAEKHPKKALRARARAELNATP